MEEILHIDWGNFSEEKKKIKENSGGKYFSFYRNAR